MDQNRCLLDVIDNPQLLQSFLESESSAETAPNSTNTITTNVSGNNQQPIITPATTIDHVTQAHQLPSDFISSDFSRSQIGQTGDASSLTETNSTESGTSDVVANIGAASSFGDAFSQSSTASSSSRALIIDDAGAGFRNDKHVKTQYVSNSHFQGQSNGDDLSSIVDPVVSVLDSIITDTVAETSPSSQFNDDDVSASVASTLAGIVASSTESASIPYSSNGNGIPCSLSPSRAAIDASSPALDSTPTYSNVGIGILSNANDANNNSTSSSDNGSNDLLVDEFYSQHLRTNVGASHQNEGMQRVSTLKNTTSQPIDPVVDPSSPKDTNTTAINFDKNISKSQSDIQSDHSHSIQPKSPIQDSTKIHHAQQEQPLHQQQIFATTEPHLHQQTTPQPSQPSLEPQLPQSTQQLDATQPQPSSQLQQVQKTQPQLFPSIQSSQLAQPQQSNQILPQTQQQSSTDSKASPAPKTPKTNTKANTSTATKAAENKPKRAPRSKKNAKTTNATTIPTPSQTTTNAPIRPMQAQFITTSQGQQQVIFQNNNGIRQPGMMAPTSMAQPMSGMPQPQRVIQIQTANGPMYFAIAPGPPAGANNNASNTNVAINQQQQSGMQSHQFPTQQICFPSNNNMMINRPQMTQTMAQQQQRHPGSAQQQQQQQQQQVNQHHQMQHQQHQQQMQTPQTQHQQQQQQNHQQTGGNIVVSGHQMIQSPQRLATPIMAGQTIAISNQQNTHQQHVMLPSSQTMMMPRMSNQIMMNRPMGTTGQLLPGQQQYIQILTPNGPMLLALPQQAQQQPVNNTMIDYNGQVQSGQMPRPMQQQQQQQLGLQQKSIDVPDGSKQSGASTGKNVSNSKSGLDLGDLLMDCGILPDDRTASQSSSSIKSSQSPSLSQISSPMPPNLPQTNSPMPTVDSTSFATHPQPTPQAMPSYGQYQGQPIRITMGPDGQMIMQSAVYGAIRPMIAGGVAQQTHLNASPNIMTSSSPMMAMASSNPSTPNSATDSPSAAADNSKKGSAKGKTTAVKRSRSKKSDIDKFPQLKTPKIAQQQQQQQPQQVAVVPMTFLVGDQSKVLAGGPEVKPNVAQLASGQQVSIAKFVSPVMQTSTIQPQLGSNMMQTSMSQHQNSLTTSQVQIINSAQMNTQMMTNSGNSINISDMQQQQQHQMQHQQQNQNSAQGMIMTSANQTSSTSGSHMSSSGNVTKKFFKSDFKTGTVESNPHISSSLMPTISLTVDNPKIEQNGLNTSTGPTQNIKGQIIRNVAGLTATLVLHQAQNQQRHSISIPSQAQLQQQQLARKKELRAQAILNQLKADQNAALNPQTKLPFASLEDACKRLLRYHVFDTEIVSETKIREVDEIFDTAVESLLTRKQAIYDKYRFLLLKQSMKSVPSNEEVMLEQVFVNDELTYLKKERELFREYEAHLEIIALKQARDDTKPESNNDCGSDYFAFGAGSPKQKDQVDQDNAAHTRDVDDWLLPDKWAESRYSSVPDSEAATAIESILNEEIS